MGVIVWVVVALAAVVMLVGWCVMRAADDGDDDEAPCVPGGYCERYARGLGGCVAGHCNRPGPRP